MQYIFALCGPSEHVDKHVDEYVESQHFHRRTGCQLTKTNINKWIDLFFLANALMYVENTVPITGIVIDLNILHVPYYGKLICG